jgi:AcrR family transcriptional regulator
MHIAEPVKRQYRSPRREESARATRRAIVDAARELFVESGYVATPLTAVADRAGVSVQTIYAQFGTKAALLKVVADQTLAGDDEAVPINDRDEARRVWEATDGRELLRRGAALTTLLHGRAAGLDTVLQQAGAGDPDVAALIEKGLAQRRATAAMVVGGLAERGWLQPGLDRAEAELRMQVFLDTALYRLSVVDRDLAPERFEEWLADLMAASLL